jgi:hypothetical protein
MKLGNNLEASPPRKLAKRKKASFIASPLTGSAIISSSTTRPNITTPEGKKPRNVRTIRPIASPLTGSAIISSSTSKSIKRLPLLSSSIASPEPSAYESIAIEDALSSLELIESTIYSFKDSNPITASNDWSKLESIQDATIAMVIRGRAHPNNSFPIVVLKEILFDEQVESEDESIPNSTDLETAIGDDYTAPAELNDDFEFLKAQISLQVRHFPTLDEETQGRFNHDLSISSVVSLAVGFLKLLATHKDIKLLVNPTAGGGMEWLYLACLREFRHIQFFASDIAGENRESMKLMGNYKKMTEYCSKENIHVNIPNFHFGRMDALKLSLPSDYTELNYLVHSTHVGGPLFAREWYYKSLIDPHCHGVSSFTSQLRYIWSDNDDAYATTDSVTVKLRYSNEQRMVHFLVFNESHRKKEIRCAYCTIS